MGISRRNRSTAAAYLLLAPSLFGVLLFLLVPVLIVVWLSFNSWDLIGPIKAVGFDNYVDVLGDGSFFHALGVTILFAVIVVPAQIALGLFAATLLTQGLRGSGLFRVLFVLPWIAAPLALGVVWSWIFAPTGGLLNTLVGHRVEWLSDPALVVPSVAAVIVWQYVGYVTLFFVAGLMNIPSQILDAATMDGAGPLQTFWQIKMPLLRPTMFFVLVTSTITVFQLFDQIYALTGGGPFTLTEDGAVGRTEVVGMRIYSEAFVAFDLGRAGVMAVILLLVLVTVTLAQQLYFRKRAVYDLS